MSWRKIKISNVMSLDDKVRVIRAYSLMPVDEKRTFKSSHKQIEKIITNRKKILWQYKLMRTKVDAAKHGCNFNASMIEISKVSLLERVIIEWIRRYQHLVPSTCVESTILQDQLEIAKIILNIQSFTATKAWIENLRLKCRMRRIKKEKHIGSLGLKEITKLILELENISKEKAQSIYGIRVFDEAVDTSDEMNEGEDKHMDVDECEPPKEHILTVEENVDSAATTTTTINGSSDDVPPLGNNTNISDNDTALIAKSSENPEVYELLENHKDFLVYVVHETENVSSKSNEKVNDPIDDNKDVIEKLMPENNIASSTIDTDRLLKDNPDALLYLKPLREYLLSQKNDPALQLLTQIESILVKNDLN